MRIIVGVSGASGVEMSYYLLKALSKIDDCETHLVVTRGAERVWQEECAKIPIERMKALADFVHAPENMAASISSGTFQTDGMIVLPCSAKSLAGIASGYCDDLLLRACDVCLKEERKVVLVPRETPLSAVHLRNMLTAKESGCTILPPMLSFYGGAADSQEGQIHHIIGKILMQFHIPYDRFTAWEGRGE